MIPKEKAREIFNKMYNVDDDMGNYPMCFDTSKQCALMAIDEIIKELTNEISPSVHGFRYKYWEEVKQEMILLSNKKNSEEILSKMIEGESHRNNSNLNK